MKFLIGILAMCILFLAIEPGVNSYLFQAEATDGCCGGQCSPHTPEEEEQSDKPCSGASCNPFQVCSSYTMLCNVKLPELQAIPAPLIKDFSGCYSPHFPAPVIHDFWQPPRVA